MAVPSGERLHFAMERSTHFWLGKIHYFDWAIFHCKMLVHQRVYQPPLKNMSQIESSSSSSWGSHKIHVPNHQPVILPRNIQKHFSLANITQISLRKVVKKCKKCLWLVSWYPIVRCFPFLIERLAVCGGEPPLWAVFSQIHFFSQEEKNGSRKNIT